jgi:hypothetical protein
MLDKTHEDRRGFTLAQLDPGGGAVLRRGLRHEEHRRRQPLAILKDAVMRIASGEC